ncbi:MAG: SEC-C metal-binding domain-containing protein, partial [Pseudonocardiaceae bacterium]
VIARVVTTFCPNDFAEDWDVDGLIAETKTYFPTVFTADELAGAATASQITDSLQTEALGFYTTREEELGPDVMRMLERQVMLTIIDHRWRQHLSEMDYLEEGINLRAMGQRDPLTEWQREGYEMFSAMINGVSDDFVRYIMHLQVVVEQAPQPDLANVSYSAPEDPSQAMSAPVPEIVARASGIVPAPTDSEADSSAGSATPTPVVKSEHAKLGRNQPCHCGSGKKFKLCHGR